MTKSDPMLERWKKLVEMTRPNSGGFSWMFSEEGLTILSQVTKDGTPAKEVDREVFGWDVLDKIVGGAVFWEIRDNAKQRICSETGEIME